MRSQFAYLLDPDSNKLQSIFWVAAYLSPVYRVLLTSDMEKMKEVKKFLQKLIPDQLDLSKEGSDVPSEFSIPGLPFLSKTLFSSSSESGDEPHRAGKLGKDLALYERKAVEFVDKLKAEALEKEDPQLFQSDPLEFWLSQVELSSV